MDLRSADSMHIDRPQIQPLRSVNDGDAVRRFIDIYSDDVQSSDVILPSGEIFSNAHHLTVNGGQYYSGQFLLQQPLHQGNYLSQPFTLGRSNLLSGVHRIRE